MTTDYRYIRAWGQMMHSASYYISEQIEQAKRDKAPKDAIYKNQDGTWARYSEVTRVDTRMLMDRLVAAR